MFITYPWMVQGQGLVKEYFYLFLYTQVHKNPEYLDTSLYAICLLINTSSQHGTLTGSPPDRIKPPSSHLPRLPYCKFLIF